MTHLTDDGWAVIKAKSCVYNWFIIGKKNLFYQLFCCYLFELHNLNFNLATVLFLNVWILISNIIT
jgi:hypothetical protein